MSTPRVTALIDTFNQGRFIEEAIESVLAQDFPASEMEILVVDDGSTDDTRARVEKYADRVRYIWKPNGGQASALNLGFEQALGEFVAPLDGDDVWLPQKVRRMVEEFEKHPEAAVVYHPYIYWIPEQNISHADATFYPVTGRMPLETKALLRYGSYGTCGMALRRTAVAVLFPIPGELRIYADSYLIFLAAFLGVAGVAEHLTRYRQHGGNLASHRDHDPEKFRQRWQCYSAAIAGGRAWLARRGYGLSEPAIAAYLKRHELVEQMLRFQCQAPGRWEYFRYLRNLQDLYAPLWTRRYGTFRSALAVAELFLGYSGFEFLQVRYRRSSVPERRDAIFPAEGKGGAGSTSGKQPEIATP